MSRRLLTILLVLLLPAGLVAWWFLDLPGVPPGLSRNQAPATPINVVVLAIDTLRADFVGPDGESWVRTPHLDALAREGTYFTRCQTTAPWTGPSFASLYTGLLPYHHGFFGRQFYSLASDNLTMAEIFAGAGYRTGAWVTVGFLTHAYGMHQGLQAGKKFTDQADGLAALQVTAGGAAFTSANRDNPFFLFLHYYDVHAPYTPPAPYDRMYVEGDPFAPGTPVLETVRDPRLNLEADNVEMHKWLTGVTDPEYPVRQYGAGVSYVDGQIGEVVQDLQRKGLYAEALIVVVADHGEHLGEHNVYYGHALPYEEVLQVPLLIKWPRSWDGPQGQVVRERVSLMDVLPTILTVTGQEVPPGLDGRSLVDLVRGKSGGPASLLVAEQGETPEQYCKTITVGDWKLMLFFVDDHFVPVLFDLAADPLELQNVAATQQAKVEELASQLWRIFDPAEPFGNRQNRREAPLDDAELQRLKSLGYIR